MCVLLGVLRTEERKTPMKMRRHTKESYGKLTRDTKRKYWKDLCRVLDTNIWDAAYKIVTKTLGYLTAYEQKERNSLRPSHDGH